MATDHSIAGVIVLGGNYGSLAVIRSLGRQGVSVAFLGDKLTVAANSRYITHFSPWAGVQEADPVSALLSFAQSHGLKNWLICPCADFEVQLVAENAEVLGKQFILQTMDWPSLRALNDKGELYELAERLGLDYPRVYASDAAPDGLTYPVVLKPSSTQTINALTRDKAWRANTAEEFAHKQAEATRLMGSHGFVVQQLIPGDGTTQLSYAGLWDHGREICQMTALRLRQLPIQFGTAPYVQSKELPRATSEARRLLSAVGYHGLVEVEFKHDHRDDKLKLLDVNTRVWAWIGLGEATGVDFPYLAARLAVGDAVPSDITPHYGASWRRAVPNILSSVQGLLQQGQPGLSAGRSIFGTAHPAVFATDDMMPAISEVPMQAVRRFKGHSH
ncbi:ATP-grasp domain-containing protein [Devosia sp. 2618]|uniref:carboxylate--amine ligase n=1 Tax=Devosia sp. 2618 TaxID=3156454 RepID=UPI0033920C6A